MFAWFSAPDPFYREVRPDTEGVIEEEAEMREELDAISEELEGEVESRLAKLEKELSELETKGSNDKEIKALFKKLPHVSTVKEQAREVWPCFIAFC